MARYIDADSVLGHIAEHKEKYPAGYLLATYAELLIAEEPTVDAVHVVRCKDCKHSHIVTAYRTNAGKDVTMLECDLDWYTTVLDWFCPYGKRKDDG